MGLYKKGKNWYIDYYYPPGRAGKRIREKIGPVKDEGRIVLAERMQDIRQGRNPALRQIKPKPFSEIVDEFLEKHAFSCVHSPGRLSRRLGQSRSNTSSPNGSLLALAVLLPTE